MQDVSGTHDRSLPWMLLDIRAASRKHDGIAPAVPGVFVFGIGMETNHHHGRIWGAKPQTNVVVCKLAGCTVLAFV